MKNAVNIFDICASCIWSAPRTGRVKTDKNMKRFLLMLSFAVMLLAGAGADASAKSMPRQRLINIANGFRRTEGFEVVNIGRFGVVLMRSAASLSSGTEDDPELREALKLLGGVKYEDGAERLRKLFNDRVESALEGCDLLMSANDGGSSVHIYGTLDEKSGRVGDLVVFTPDEGALICVFGSFPMDAVAQLANMR